MLKAEEVARILRVSLKRLDEVIRPTVAWSARRRRYSPADVICVIEGRPQPERGLGLEWFVRGLPGEPMTDADISHFFAIPTAVVPYLSIPELDAPTIQYDKRDVLTAIKRFLNRP
ncbi:MAG: hypothetical protein WC731_06485 [Candidatus Omnitrophota bacterium]|jgi:hypothetical protein